MSPDRHARTMLPIPDRPSPGLTTYDAKDPDTAFPPIEPLVPPEGQASNGPIGEDCHTGTSWHLPNWAVESPFSFNVIANGAFVFGRNELFPGADVAVSVMLPIPTEW